jgi:hypothetical protein
MMQTATNSPRRRRGRLLPIVTILLAAGMIACWALAAPAGDAPAQPPRHWYRGSTHLHSFWSDGDEFPEMVAVWYKEHDYQFIMPSDHNTLMAGPRWVKIQDKKKPIPMPVFLAYLRRFKQPWVESRGRGPSQEVRLKTFDEIAKKLEEPGKFLMIQAEEITGKCGDKEVHVNALNAAEAIAPQQGPTVAETLRRDLAAVAEQSKRLGQPILAQVNHPNWRHYDIPPEDLAAAADARLFEVCNANADSNHEGDAANPGHERIWDLVNTIRLAEMKSPPIYGVASDDTHNYHQFGPGKANPGRAWIMVRAGGLCRQAILDGMRRGDFYASTGVELTELKYDAAASTLSVAARPQAGGRYRIEFIGTLADFDRVAGSKTAPRAKGDSTLSPLRNNPQVGKVLHAVEGASATYQLTGKELYVRAVVRSDLPMDNPPGGKREIRLQTAWCQPVGWERWVESSSK